MGIVPLSLQIFLKHLNLVGSFEGLRMMELGDQQMYCHVNIPEASAAKSWFERMGVKHTSVDINGELGAVPLDLSKPIDRPEWNGAFDVVTDYGTSEHVGKSLEALYQCRASCHGWCRQGGLMFFNNPMTGHWPGHGYHYFTEDHYRNLAQACNYEIVELFNHPTLGNSKDGFQIYAVLRKTQAVPFISLEEYTALCNGTVFEK